MKQREYLQNADVLTERIKKGAFLTVQAGDKLNTMTIGWYTIGYIWRKPVFMVAVRDSRYTFQLIEQSDSYTVTIPKGEDYKDAVMFCGTKSGRDYNKFSECKIAVKASQKIQTPVIDIPGIHYECRIIYKSAMDSAFLDNELDTGLYPEKDYHTLYFGEIVACYETV